MTTIILASIAFLSLVGVRFIPRQGKLRHLWLILCLVNLAVFAEMSYHSYKLQDKVSFASRCAELMKYPIEVMKTDDADLLIRELRNAGFTVVLKNPDLLKLRGEAYMKKEETTAIRLQHDIPVEHAVQIIEISRSVWPRLEYVYFDDISPKLGTFVGNYTPTVLLHYRLRPLSDEDFTRLTRLRQTPSEFRSLVRSFQGSANDERTQQ